MFARIITGPFKAGSDAEVIAIYRDSILPALKQQPGFVRGQMLMDRTQNTITSVTVWQSAAALESGGTSGFVQEQLAKLGAYLAGQMTITSTEVVVES